MISLTCGEESFVDDLYMTDFLGDLFLDARPQCSWDLSGFCRLCLPSPWSFLLVEFLCKAVEIGAWLRVVDGCLGGSRL